MSIQKEVENYLAEQPSLLEPLQEGLLNYSALVRKIISETSLKEKDFDAVLVSLRRYHRKIQKTRKEKRDLNYLLRNSTLEVKNKRAVIILEKDAPLRLLTRIIERIEKEKEQLSMTQTANAITLITHQRFLTLFEKLELYILKRTEELVALTIHSPENLEETPGFVAHLTALLASKGINLVELTSCYTDTLIILEREDAEHALQALHF